MRQNCLKKCFLYCLGLISTALNYISIGQISTGLFFRKRQTYSSSIGGLLTICALIAFIVLSIYAVTDVTNRTNVIASVQLKELNIADYNATLYDNLVKNQFWVELFNTDSENKTELIFCDDFYYYAKYFDENNAMINITFIHCKDLVKEENNGIKNVPILYFQDNNESRNFIIASQQHSLLILIIKKQRIQDLRIMGAYRAINKHFDNQNLQDYLFVSSATLFFGYSQSMKFEKMVFNHTNYIWLGKPTYKSELYFRCQDISDKVNVTYMYDNYTSRDLVLEIDYRSFNDFYTVYTVTPLSILDALARIGGYLSLLRVLAILLQILNQLLLERELKKQYKCNKADNTLDKYQQQQQDLQTLLTQQNITQNTDQQEVKSKETKEDLTQIIKSRYSFEQIDMLIEQMRRIYANPRIKNILLEEANPTTNNPFNNFNQSERQDSHPNIF